MLIIDYDVTRYHSLDLLRYQLYKSRDFFVGLKEPYASLRTPGPLADQVKFGMDHLDQINVLSCSTATEHVVSSTEYEDYLNQMFQDPVSRQQAIQTDIASRFDIVFERPGISGVLLRYKKDTKKPSCYNRLVVYDVDHLLDGDVAVELILKHKINAVMVSSVALAVQIGARLIQRGYTDPVTFMTGIYDYNYIHTAGGKLPILMKEIATLIERYQYEFGVFDPFTGITERYKYLQTLQGGTEDETSDSV